MIPQTFDAWRGWFLRFLRPKPFWGWPFWSLKMLTFCWWNKFNTTYSTYSYSVTELCFLECQTELYGSNMTYFSLLSPNSSITVLFVVLKVTKVYQFPSQDLWSISTFLAYHIVPTLSWHKTLYIYLFILYLIGGFKHVFLFPFSWECHHPNWL